MLTFLFLSFCDSATNPARAKFRQREAAMFQTNSEGKLVISEEGGGEEEGQEKDTTMEQDVDTEEMEVVEVRT